MGHPAQLGRASGGLAVGGPPTAGSGLLSGEQPLVEIDGGEVAEAGDGHVEELAGGGLQVQGITDAGAGLVEEGEVAAGAGGLAGGDVPAGDVGGEAGDADGPAGPAVHPVEVHGPVAALGAAGVVPTSWRSVTDSPVSRTRFRVADSRSASALGR